MTPPLPSRTIEVTCRGAGLVGPCHERDCSLQASIRVEAADGGHSTAVFACRRHVQQGMVRALALRLGVEPTQFDRGIAAMNGTTPHDHDQRLVELEEAWQSLTLEVGRLTRRARLLVNMKAATLIATCQRCGNEYANEPGPKLCGPCWVTLGKPQRYLSPAEPI